MDRKVAAERDTLVYNSFVCDILLVENSCIIGHGVCLVIDLCRETDAKSVTSRKMKCHRGGFRKSGTVKNKAILCFETVGTVGCAKIRK